VRSPRAAGRKVLQACALTGVLTLAACGAQSAPRSAQAPSSQGRAAAANPDLDPGSALGSMPAPGFRLVNQFGQPMSLSQFRGKIVILAFVDSLCTTVCPLTTVSMTEAKQLLGPAGDSVQLLGVDANPQATSVSDVMGYSRVHALVNQWDFLTGPAASLRAAWQAYHIYVQIQKGQIDHTPALFVIDQQGRERMVYLTTMAYASVGQEAEVLAREAASLLPSHPKLATEQSLAYIAGLEPGRRATLPGVPAGSVSLGPGQPHLVLFFATWLTGTSDLGGQLMALNAYAQAARGGKLPPLTAVDEAATEPSPDAARAFIGKLPRPLGYPVALDETGRLADGYGVQDQPYLILTSASGRIVWTHDGWLSASALETAVRKATATARG
jgi:cytochrome oxidase Cu insertion factor (SCO1/SenC/PrrC family)